MIFVNFSKFFNNLNKFKNAVLTSFPSNEAWISGRVKQQISYELPELSIALSWRRKQMICISFD